MSGDVVFRWEGVVGESSVLEWPLRTVEVCGHSIAVVDGTRGQDGPAVVLIHGVAMTVHLWPELLRSGGLGNCRWVSMGLPGHYPSLAPAGFQSVNVSPELIGGCVLAVIREFFGDEPAHVVGWSTGGFAGLCAGAMSVEEEEFGAAPERLDGVRGRVRSVVSICGFARGSWGSVLGAMQRLSRRGAGRVLLRWGMRRLAASPWLLRRVFVLLSARSWEGADDVRAGLEVVIRDFRRHDLRVMTVLFQGLFRQDISERVRGLVCPLLVVAGERDPVIPLSEGSHIHGLVSHSRLVTLSGAGHMFFGEALEECLGLVREWLAEHSGVKP